MKILVVIYFALICLQFYFTVRFGLKYFITYYNFLHFSSIFIFSLSLFYTERNKLKLICGSPLSINRNRHRVKLTDHCSTFKTYLLLTCDKCFIQMGTMNLRKLYKRYNKQNFMKIQNSLQTLTRITDQNITL